MRTDGHFLVGAADDDVWTDLTDHFVQMEGLYTAHRERGVKAILQQLRYHEVDLIFSERELKDGNIFQLAEAMKQDGMTRGIPLVLIDERLTSVVRKSASEAGVDFAIERPFRRDELKKTIRAALHQ